MPSTPNFGWTMPTVGGSNNAWGTLLNALFIAIDAALQTVADAVEAAITSIVALQAAAVAQKTVYVSGEVFQPGADEDDVTYGAGSGTHVLGDENKNMWAALPPLPLGAVLDQVIVYLDKNGNTNIAATLIRCTVAGAQSDLKTATESGSGLQALGLNSIAFTVDPSFLKVKVAPGSGSFHYKIYGMAVVYTPAA